MGAMPLRREDLPPFCEELFDRPEQARRAAAILHGILAAPSPRLSEVAQAMARSTQANYKAIQRFLAEVDPREVLLRLWDEDAPFILADPTEVPRRQARRTEYVGQPTKRQDPGLLAAAAGPALQGEGAALPLHHLFGGHHGG